MKIWTFLFILALVNANHEQFSGWKSYYVEMGSPHHYDTLSVLEDKYQLGILRPPTGDDAGIVLVKADLQDTILKIWDKEGISHRVHVDDIKRQLDHEDVIVQAHTMDMLQKKHGQSFPYDSYQDLEVVENYLDYIGQTYPNITTVVDAGKSFEGRSIKYLKISSTQFKNPNKPVIFIDAGTHAREWISIPVATWAIRKLVEDVTDKELLDKFDWIIFPVVNPDGYKYTQQNNRFWRKTRSVDQHRVSLQCPGVDINRNFDIMWNTSGTSTNPCIETYCGSQAFSEVETRTVRDILMANSDRIALYISLHSYGSMILYSWSHDGSLSKYDSQLESIGNVMAKAIDLHSLPDFPRYKVGNGVSLLHYFASGTSSDYAHSLGIVFAYVIELPGPTAGFILHPNYIEQVCKETWGAIVDGAKHAVNFYKIKLI